LAPGGADGTDCSASDSGIWTSSGSAARMELLPSATPAHSELSCSSFGLRLISHCVSHPSHCCCCSCAILNASPAESSPVLPASRCPVIRAGVGVRGRREREPNTGTERERKARRGVSSVRCFWRRVPNIPTLFNKARRGVHPL